jgi:hypothetical protein
MLRIEQPSWVTRCLQTAEPINPAPPVTITRIVFQCPIVSLIPDVLIKVSGEVVKSRVEFVLIC